MATATLDQQRSSRGTRRVFFRALVSGLIAVLLIAGSLVAWLYWRAHACLPQLDGAVEVAGLEAPVEVSRDARGVPHIRARSLEDAVLAQGYVTAQDRLWQMDMSRRLARGELSEVLGRRTIELDIENRKLGLAEAADRAVRELDPQSREVLAAYARGVNAFIGSHKDRLPIEFLLLRYQPQAWREADSIGVALNMAKRLNTSWRTDLMRERLRRELTPQLYADLFPDRSPLDHPVAEPVAGPVRAAHPDGGRALVSEFPSTGTADLRAATSKAEVALLAEPADDFDLALGSNNWVVSGAHTQSGKPLLANDPHLSHSVPSVWYQIELEAPGLHVAGVSLPGGPLVVVGHNDRIAWGMTNTGPDVQDLYLETFKPGDPNKYLVNGRWIDAEVREEHIKVRRAADVHLTARATRHGPVIGEDGKYSLALKWTALQPHALNFTFLKMDQAQNWEQFKDAIRSFTGPEQNMVYADVDGNIGYYAPAWVPIRKRGDGSAPVPGDSDDYEWIGYLPFEGLPHAYNPAGGIIATANSRVVPDHYPYFITHDWAAPWRTARIFELLEAGGNFTVADMLRIEIDIHSLEDEDLARELLEAGAAHPPANAEAQSALSLLHDWDGEARTNSAATLISELTRPALLERLLKPKLGPDASVYRWLLSATFVDNAIHNNWTRWLPPGDADFNVTLMNSLEDSLKQIQKLAGSKDPSAWRWGYTIPLTFHHPLDGIPFGRRLFDVGPFPQMGMGTTIKATTSGSGPSMRMVVDFSDLDQSVNNITLGESGQALSPYYKDQLDAWSSGNSFPMLFSDAAVEKGAVHKLVLEPGR